MSLLYRSPNLLIDVHEWHAQIMLDKRKHVITRFKFRPLGPPARMWQALPAWHGRLPKGLKENFRPFFRHMELARQSVRRAAA